MFKSKITGDPTSPINEIRIKMNNDSFIKRAKRHFKVWYGFKKCTVLWFLSGATSDNRKRYDKWMGWNE